MIFDFFNVSGVSAANYFIYFISLYLIRFAMDKIEKKYYKDTRTKEVQTDIKVWQSYHNSINKPITVDPVQVISLKVLKHLR